MWQSIGLCVDAGRSISADVGIYWYTKQMKQHHVRGIKKGVNLIKLWLCLVCISNATISSYDRRLATLHDIRE